MSPPPAEAGLTLLECIIAILVVGIVGATIAPAMVVSVATRIQSQKAEQALQVAQGEVDQVRLLVERGATVVGDLPPEVTGVTYETIGNAGAPKTLTGGPTTVPTAYTQARPVDIDGDGTNDFAVQMFRSPLVNNASGEPIMAFGMGVRVYDIQAFTSGNTLSKDEAFLGFTSDSAERETGPLAVLYTTVTASADGQSFCDFIKVSDPSGAVKAPQGCN